MSVFMSRTDFETFLTDAPTVGGRVEYEALSDAQKDIELELSSMRLNLFLLTKKLAGVPDGVLEFPRDGLPLPYAVELAFYYTVMFRLHMPGKSGLPDEAIIVLEDGGLIEVFRNRLRSVIF